MAGAATGAGASERRPRFGEALRVRAFAVLYAAETQSTVGDQLARVALSILVFRRTGSAAATALTYAGTYLPAILGGVVLGGIGDRLSRRLVMIGCDVVRAGLFAAMAAPGLPIGGIIALLVVAVFIGPAFAAAEVSYLAAALEPEVFRVGTGLRMISNQAAQVFGFALGGVLVSALGARRSLLVDAATYVASALAVGLLLRRERPPRAVRNADEPPAATAFAGIWADRRVRVLLLMSALAGLFVVPEGLAVPFGHDAGASTVETGLLLASIPFGGALGAVCLVRFVPRSRRRPVANAMVIGCGLPLVITGLAAHWPLALVCWALSGALAAYQVEVVASVVHLIPDTSRSRVIGVASSLLLGAQGVGLVLFGLVARFATPAHAIGAAGLVGSGCAVGLVLVSSRHAPGRHRSGDRPAREERVTAPGPGSSAR